MEIVVVIPVYKNPDSDELKSLKQCCRILSRYKISLVCPKGFDTRTFDEIWKSFGLDLYVEEFNSDFFNSISGYNRLLLSECFYSRFSDFDYMLIYQPDAYVFYDGLEEWCKKGYDYVGAPFVRFNEDRLELSVGNGGLSLRRISSFLAYFKGKRNVFGVGQIANRISLFKKPYTRIFVWLFMLCGWRNKPQGLANHYRHNEDIFWSRVLLSSRYALTVPSGIEALSFAFECFPKELYDLAGCKLPFGCHAWKKYQFEEFWSKYIR